MNLLLFANKFYNKVWKSNVKMSFSQSGEDLIILFLIRSLKLKDVSYIDIGTNDPRDMNNTYLLYLNNFRGICVEPDPSLQAKIKTQRPGDTLVPYGIDFENKAAADFYIMDDSVLNTFSKANAIEMVENHQRKIIKKISVPLISIHDLLNKGFAKNKHIVLSIDVEGLDYAILKSIDWTLHRPVIVCVETISYSKNLTGEKDNQLIALLLSNNYKLYADTHINSIFLDSSLLQENKANN